jgi:hypothetical protein
VNKEPHEGFRVLVGRRVESFVFRYTEADARRGPLRVRFAHWMARYTNGRNQDRNQGAVVHTEAYRTPFESIQWSHSLDRTSTLSDDAGWDCGCLM